MNERRNGERIPFRRGWANEALRNGAACALLFSVPDLFKKV